MKDYNEIIDLLEANLSKEAKQYLINNDVQEDFYSRFYNSMVCKTKQTIIKNAKKVTVHDLEDIYC